MMKLVENGVRIYLFCILLSTFVCGLLKLSAGIFSSASRSRSFFALQRHSQRTFVLQTVLFLQSFINNLLLEDFYYGTSFF